MLRSIDSIDESTAILGMRDLNVGNFRVPYSRPPLKMEILLSVGSGLGPSVFELKVSAHMPHATDCSLQTCLALLSMDEPSRMG